MKKFLSIVILWTLSFFLSSAAFAVMQADESWDDLWWWGGGWWASAAAVQETVDNSRFDSAMEKSVESIRNNIEAAERTKWTEWIKNFVFEKVMSVLVPLIVVLGILIAILWFYKILFSSDEKAKADWTRFILYWALWIILIMSAKYIWTTIYEWIFNQWDNTKITDILWWNIAQEIYDKLVFPFLKLAIYLSLWALFVILVSRVFTFIFAKDDDTKKKAWTLIWRNILWMLVIIGSKQIVEAVYWKKADVLKDVSNLWQIWTSVMAERSIPLFYQVINRAIWLLAFVILVMIIIQTVQLLTKPDDEKQMGKIKNTLLYIFIWIALIGICYLIVNFLIIN